MVMDTLMDRPNVQPILPVKSVTIDTILKFDDDLNWHGDGDSMCKQTFKLGVACSQKIIKILN